MTVSQQLLSEIKLLPKEYEQSVLDYVSFLLHKKIFMPVQKIKHQNAYGILKGSGIDSNIERDESERI